MATQKRILVINPNSTQSMTDGLKPLVAKLDLQNTQVDFWTAPSGPPSINNDNDLKESTIHCLSSNSANEGDMALEHQFPKYDAFLVACYSEHPLVFELKNHKNVGLQGKPVIGIFEASITAALSLTANNEYFGIISTGAVWEGLLGRAVNNFLGGPSQRFIGVGTTGLNATELHDADPEELRRRIIHATEQLFFPRGADGSRAEDPIAIQAICLGCAGMSGMDELVREGCVLAIGEENARRVKIIDGVLAGTAWLESTLRWLDHSTGST